MRGLHKDSVLGKCHFCRDNIVEGSKHLVSKHAKVTYGKMVMW
jgi:hypothetical protein